MAYLSDERTLPKLISGKFIRNWQKLRSCYENASRSKNAIATRRFYSRLLLALADSLATPRMQALPRRLVREITPASHESVVRPQ